MDKETIEVQLLKAMLPHIPFDGWQDAAVLQAAKACDLSADQARAIFNDMPMDAIKLHHALFTDFVCEKIIQNRQEKMRLSENLICALMAGYQEFAADRPAIKAAYGILLLPHYQAKGIKLALLRADQIWRTFQDQSLDFNYYSKRGLLCAVLLSVTPVFLQDETADLTITEAFLRRRIANILAIPKWKADFKARCGGLSAKIPSFLKSKKYDLTMRGL